MKRHFHGYGLLASLLLWGSPAQAQEPVQPVYDQSAITGETRADFYHLAEGSEMYPYAWVKALKDPKTGRPFLENIERFGMIPDPTPYIDPEDKSAPPYRLPIGVSLGRPRDFDKKVLMIGVNCAGCHTGLIRYQGHSMVIPGAPSMISMDRFYGGIFEAVMETFKDPGKADEFFATVASDPSFGLGAKTQQLVKEIYKLQLEGKASADFEGSFFDALRSRFHDLHLGEQNSIQGAPVSVQPRNIRKSITEAPAHLVDFLKNEKSRITNRFSSAGEKLKDHLESQELRRDLDNYYRNMYLLKGRVDFLKKIRSFHQGSDALPARKPGPGRSDAFGVISNIAIPGAGIPLTAPVSYPFIWSVDEKHETVWFHYDGNTTSLLRRNVGQAIGLGAPMIDKTARTPDFLVDKSTVEVANLDRLQEITRMIRPPVWPSFLPAIDNEKASRGKLLYQKYCINCHADPFTEPVYGEPKLHDPNKPGKRENYIDYKVVGTDPERIRNYEGRRVKAGPDDREGTEYIDALKATATTLTNKSLEYVKDKNLVQKIQKESNEWKAMPAYVARPLVAIWATSPYLHNGSVPTLYDLLKPARERPVLFTVGSQEFDPIKVGYVTKTVSVDTQDDTLTEWVFNTTLSGNQNIGHEYGTSMTDPERYDLIEYLKVNYLAHGTQP